jgi:hypothetical protein
MGNLMLFGEVVEVADKLTLDELETLLEVLHRRIVERRRAELTKDVQNAQQEFKEGGCKSVTPAELMQEILS